MADDAEFQSDLSEVAKKCSATSWNSETLQKVHNFRNYSLSEKDSVIKCLIVDLSNSYDVQEKLKIELAELKSKVEDQQESALKIISLKNDLDGQIHANQLCISEKIKFETQFLNLKKVMDSWCISAQKANRCISETKSQNK